MKKGLKITMLCCALVLGGAGLASACVGTSTYATQDVLCVRAEGEEQSSEVTETQEIEEWKQKITEFKNTVLIPILGGVSITSVVSLVLTLVVNYIRGKKLDKKCVDSEAKLAEATAILATITKIYNDVAEDKKINEETKTIISTQMKDLVEKIDANTNVIEKINKIEPILKLLVQLETKLAKANSDVIASGAMKDVSEITKLIKEF